MDSAPPSSAAIAEHARAARELLVSALGLLQRSPSDAEPCADAIRHTASASSALYQSENESSTPQATTAGVRIAIERLGDALSALRALEQTTGSVHPATETVARTLALLYPVGRASLRQRRDVMLGGEQAANGVESLRGLAQLSPAPEPLGKPRDSQPYAGENHRKLGERTFVEVDIGLLSDSYFYAGLSQDVSRGGVFVATYEKKRPGTRVALYFVLPDGHAVSADGVVRWTREAGPDLPPGMGIAFENIQPRDIAAIDRYCKQRDLIYHDLEDD